MGSACEEQNSRSNRARKPPARRQVVQARLRPLHQALGLTGLGRGERRGERPGVPDEGVRHEEALGALRREPREVTIPGLLKLSVRPLSFIISLSF